MSSPLSKSKLSRLGARLASEPGLTASEQEDFEAAVRFYDDLRQRAQGVVRRVATDLFPERGLVVTGRTKTTLTLRDKLRRSPEVKLPYVRDIAGVRLVGRLSLTEQNLLAEAFRSAFGSEETTKLVDRRAEPAAGYRAVHVIPLVEGLPVEIQIRTELQALWAELYERQADRWGRQIRYGELPDLDASGSNERRIDFLNSLERLSLETIAEYEKHFDELVLIDNATYEAREAEAREVLKKRTASSLRKSTQMRAEIAKLRSLELDVMRMTIDWERAVRTGLRTLASEADTVD